MGFYAYKIKKEGVTEIDGLLLVKWSPALTSIEPASLVSMFTLVTTTVVIQPGIELWSSHSHDRCHVNVPGN